MNQQLDTVCIADDMAGVDADDDGISRCIAVTVDDTVDVDADNSCG